VNAIEKMVQGLPVLLTEKEKPGVRSQPERFFTEAKKFEIHNPISGLKIVYRPGIFLPKQSQLPIVFAGQLIKPLNSHHLRVE
jgi:hypothetical protein